MEVIESAGRAPSFKLYPGICLTTQEKLVKLLPVELRTVFSVSRQGVGSKGDTQLMKRVMKCFTLGAPYLPSQSQVIACSIKLMAIFLPQ